jgi:predicted transcriptional regulator
MTVEIVAAYVGNHTVPAAKLPKLIESVYDAVATLEKSGSSPEQTPMPAVPVSESIDRRHLVCLEDGKRFKSLKRHLRVAHGLSPNDYRAKWRLPEDYPMVAPSYSAKRSRIAKAVGLGRKSKPSALRRNRSAKQRSVSLRKAA